jgi:membrane protease YdiL (CAAX protease family)
MHSIRSSIQRHPAITYFIIAYLVPALSFAILVLPKLMRGGHMQALDALTLFPIMELGVCLAGIVLTGVVDGRSGLRNLFARIGRRRAGIQWYGVAVLIPPILISLVLFVMSKLVSPVFTPKFFALGLLYGISAGLLEEIGWMGFAFPHMNIKRSTLTTAILLGLLWGLWHAPVVDYLGSAAPHGAYWLPFYLAFIALLVAMRVLIVWIYSNTDSLLLAQILHASSTGFLVVLSPIGVTPAQEALWYAVYAAVVWIVVVLVMVAFGKGLVRSATKVQAK